MLQIGIGRNAEGTPIKTTLSFNNDNKGDYSVKLDSLNIPAIHFDVIEREAKESSWFGGVGVAFRQERHRAGLLNKLAPTNNEKYRQNIITLKANDLVDDWVQANGLNQLEYSFVTQDDVGSGVNIVQHNYAVRQRRKEVMKKQGFLEQAKKLAAEDAGFWQDVENQGRSLADAQLDFGQKLVGQLGARLTFPEEYAFGILGFKAAQIGISTLAKLGSVTNAFAQSGVFNPLLRNLLKGGMIASLQELGPQFSIARNMRRDNLSYTMEEAALSIMAVGFMGATIGGFTGAFSIWRSTTKVKGYVDGLDKSLEFLSKQTDPEAMAKVGGKKKFDMLFNELQDYRNHLKHQADNKLLPDVPIDQYIKTTSKEFGIDKNKLVDFFVDNGLFGKAAWENISHTDQAAVIAAKGQLVKKLRFSNNKVSLIAQADTNGVDALKRLNPTKWKYKTSSPKDTAKYLRTLIGAKELKEQRLNPAEFARKKFAKFAADLDQNIIASDSKETLQLAKSALAFGERLKIETAAIDPKKAPDQLIAFVKSIKRKKTLKGLGVVDADGKFTDDFKKLITKQKQMTLKSEAKAVRGKYASLDKEQKALFAKEYELLNININAAAKQVRILENADKGYWNAGIFSVLHNLDTDEETLRQILYSNLAGIEKSLGSVFDMKRPKLSELKKFIAAVGSGETKDVADPELAGMVSGIRRMFKQALDMLETYGFEISDELKGSYIPLSFMTVRVAKLQRSDFVEYMIKRINQQATSKKLNLRADKLPEFIGKMYDNIITDNMLTVSDRLIVKESRLNFRSLIFNSFDDQADVLVKFGPEKATDWLTDYIGSTAKVLSIRQNLGSNVQEMFKMLDRASTPDFAKTSSLKAQSWNRIKDAYTRTVIGPTKGAYNQAVADMGSGFRSLGIVAYLGKSLFSAFVDPVWTFGTVSVQYGSVLEGFKAVGTVYKNLILGNKKLTDAMQEFGFGLELLMESGARRFVGRPVSGAGSKYANNFLAATGLPSFTEIDKGVVRQFALRQMTESFDSPDWLSIPEYTKRMFVKYGITKQEWDFVKAKDFIVGADDLRFVDLPKIMNSNLELGKKFNKWINEGAKIGSPSPDALIRSLQSWGYKSGSVPGELLKMFLQFTSFSMSAMRSLNFIYANAASGKAAAQTFMPMLVLGTGLGAVLVQMKELLKGRTPRDMDYSLMMDGLLLTGFVPLLIEKPFSGYLRGESVWESMLSFPALGLINNTASALTNLAKVDDKTGEWSPNPDKLIREMFRYVPGFQLWYSQALAETVVMNPFRKWVSPVNAKRAFSGLKGALKTKGQTTWTLSFTE